MVSIVSNKTPLVSVLMPVFNRETLVIDAIRSIQDQTLEDWELIILDDASSDRTFEVCRSFEKKDNRIRVFANKQNLGVGRTRARLTEFATGKYIAVQDSDDTSHPEKLALQVEVLESKPDVGLVTIVAEMLDEDGRVIKHYPQGLYQGLQFPQDKTEMIKQLYLGSGIEGPGYMFRRTLLDEIPDLYGNCRVIDDWYFFLQVTHRTQIWGIPTVLLTMRRGRNHLHVGADQQAAQAEVKIVRKVIYSMYRNDKDSPINYWLYRKSIASSLRWRARVLGGWKGLRNSSLSLVYNPFDKITWALFGNFVLRGFRRAIRFL